MRYHQYTTTYSYPVAVQFKCPYCGYDNIRAFYIRGESVSNYRPNETAAYQKLVDKVDALMSAPDINTLQSAGLNCVCKQCGKTPPWASMGGLSKNGTIRLIMLGLMLLSAMILYFTVDAGEAGLFYSMFNEHLGITAAMLAIIIIAVIVIIFLPRDKGTKATDEEIMPKVIAVGEDAMKYNPPERARFV